MPNSTTTETTSPAQPEATPDEPSVARTLLAGVAVGALAAVLIALLAWLSPLSAGDRRGLALLAVTASLPVGCIAARLARGWRDALAVSASGLVAGAVLATGLTVFGPSLWWTTLVWCAGAGWLGASVTGLATRGAGVAVSGLWLFLGGLPFFYDKSPWFEQSLEGWALQGAPWLGFSMDAFGGDPLRMPIIYMGKMSELTSVPAAGVLSAGTLWLAAAFACAALTARWVKR
jgi:hypothetical protein